MSKRSRRISAVTSFLAVTACVFLPRSSLALREQAIPERDSADLAGLEENLLAEGAQSRVEAALERIRQGSADFYKLLKGVTIRAIRGKGVRIEGDRIILGMEVGKGDPTLAQLLVWAGAAHRAVGLIRARADKISAEAPGDSKWLRQLHQTLVATPIQLHRGRKTTLYEGRIFLNVGGATTLERMVQDLMRAGRSIGKGEGQTEQAALPGQSAEDVAFALFSEGAAETDRQLREAYEKGQEEAKQDLKKQVQEPELDQALVATMKRHMTAQGVGPAAAWPVFAAELSTTLKLNDRDRQVELMERLFNVYGFLEYSEDVGASSELLSESTVQMNNASDAAQSLANALVEYLNDPYDGPGGDKAQQELLADIALGIHLENLLSYLRLGHIPQMLSNRIRKPIVSAQRAQERVKTRLAEAGSPLKLTMERSIAGLLTGGSQGGGLLAIAGPTAAAAADKGRPEGPVEYFPELPSEPGYRIGATGLIEEWQQAMAGASSLDQVLKRIPKGFAANLDLALSRPGERTANGTSELSEVLMFFFSLGSSAGLQQSWRPYLGDLDLPSLAKQTGRSETMVAAGLFVWQIVQAYLQKKKDDAAATAVLNELTWLGKNRDGIFQLVADFHQRHGAAAKRTTEVAQAAAAEKRADLLAGKEKKGKKKREEFEKGLQEMGLPTIPLAAGPATPGSAAADAGLMNAPTFEGFVYRLHQLDLSDERVLLLNTDKESAGETLARLVGGHEKGAEQFKKGMRGLMQALHPDRRSFHLMYVAGEVDGVPIEKLLYNNLLSRWKNFPGSGWWEKDTIGTALKKIKEKLPNFDSARVEVKAAEDKWLREQLVELQQTVAAQAVTIRELTQRLEAMEKRLGLSAAPAPQPPASAGLEEAGVEVKLEPIESYLERNAARWAQLDLEDEPVESVLTLRAAAPADEPPLWTVHGYFVGQRDILQQALRLHLGDEPVPGVRMGIERFSEMTRFQRPGLFFRQGGFTPERELPSDMVRVELPGETGEALAVVQGLDPAALVAAAFSPKLWPALANLRVQARQYQDEEGHWVLALFL